MSSEIVCTKTIPAHFVRGIYYPTRILEIKRDPYPDNPRENYDHVGTMVCFHRNYDLGDNHDIDVGDFDTWDEVEKHLYAECGAEIVLPLYLYDHSGITMNTTGFSCSWDSGKVGFIYASKENIEKMMLLDPENMTPEQTEHIREILRGEVEEYDDYLKCDVYYWILKDKDGERIDSCYGYYGYPSGIKDILAEHQLDPDDY